MRIGDHATHEASDLFSLLGETELAALRSLEDLPARAAAEDVKSHGLNVPIVLFDERILDGRNRYLACLRAEVEPRFEEWKGEDPVAFVLSHNLHRRHLDASQRAMVAAQAKVAFEEAAALRRRATQNNNTGRAVPANLQERGEAAEKAADLLNVGVRSVYHAEKVLEHGTPELVAAVERGELAVSTAADVTELSKEEQAATVAEGPARVAERVRAIRRRRRAKPPKGFIERAPRSVARGQALETPPGSVVERNPKPEPFGHAFETFEELPSAKYRCLYMDPAWEHPDGMFIRSNEERRPVTEEDLAALDLARICHPRGSHLWLWVTWTLLRREIPQRLFKQWGFVWESELVWEKERPGRGDYWIRPKTEILLVASRGSLGLRDQETVGFLDDPHDTTGKPPSVRDLIQRNTAGPRVELFSRTLVPGWDAFAPELVLVKEAPAPERKSA